MDYLKLNFEGHVLITDADSGRILLNQRNAIHFENFAFALLSSLTDASDTNGLKGNLNLMAFGSGGALVDGSGNVTYNTPNVTDITDGLHNLTYSKAVNNNFDDDPNNSTRIVHTNGTTYSDIVVTCTLDYNEPSSQDALDNTTSYNDDYIFDEIGLVSQQGRLLTHLIFHPVQKSANRKIQVVYTIRITAG